MPSDEGKKGVAGRKLEDDDLFKQIGGQLGIDANKFTYDQWQRHDRGGPVAPSESKKTVLPKQAASAVTVKAHAGENVK